MLTAVITNIDKPAPKLTMGRLTDESIQEIEQELSLPKRLSHYELHARQVAIDLIYEFRERIKTGFEISEILAAVRHAVYEMGALEPLELDKEAEVEAREKGNGEYQNYLKRKTILCLRALGRQEENNRNEHLGLIRARFLDPDTEKAEQEYFDPTTGKLKININGRTPIDALIAIVALAEKEHSPTIVSSLSLAKSAAQEQLIRRLVSGNEDVIKKGTEFFTRRFIDAVIDQMPDSLSKGRIGGKGAGILLAYAALEKETPEFDQKFAAEHGKTTTQLKDILSLGMEFAENQSYFLGSGVFETFMRENSIGEASIVKDKYKHGECISQKEFEDLRQQILAGNFPRHVERQLKILFLEHLHGKPIICRSSSELEDRQGASFAGQYRSEELPNSSDNPEEDFKKFLTAIKEIYASTFNPGVMEYRRAKGLLYEDEEMGILVQTLNGREHGKFFHPDFSAVTQSRATEATCDNPKHGLLRIGVGLGESVVELNEGVVTSLRSPNIREEKPKRQKFISTLNLDQQSKQSADWKNLMEQGGLSGDTIEFSVRRYDRDDDRWIECYDGDKMTKYGHMDLYGILKSTNVPLYLEYITQKLKHIYGHEVDCEFTIQHDPKKGLWTIKLVQCRPLNIPENMRPTVAPKEAIEDKKRVLMHARECINSTYTTNLTHIFYIDPKIYQDGSHRELTTKAVEYMSKINKLVAKGKCLVLSPRRFGSKDFGSGVPAEFHQFSNMGGVIEVFDGNTVCDPSAGAHFPQLLNDTGMVLGHCRDHELNDEFFSQAKHSDKFHAPPTDIAKYVKVVDLTEYGLNAHVSQDNTHEDPHENFSTLYMAEEDKDVPIQLVT